MCTRFILLKDQLHAAYVALGVEAPSELISRYNIAPSTALTAFRRPSRTATPERATLRWGLVPSWAQAVDASAPLVNARAETLTAKPSFRDAFRQRRCVVPAGGFYEWAIHGRARKPWLFQRPDAAVFFFAGLWESWRAPSGDVLESCAIITTTPNAITRPIHDRMPVLLTPDATRTWLDGGAHIERPRELRRRGGVLGVRGPDAEHVRVADPLPGLDVEAGVEAGPDEADAETLGHDEVGGKGRG
jgi:putative SOS response-associated peptidase YedK